jgi:hypothetical protein
LISSWVASKSAWCQWAVRMKPKSNFQAHLAC